MRYLLALLAAALPLVSCAAPEEVPAPPAPPTHGMPKIDLKHPDATCGNLMYFDFMSAADGPAYYVDKSGVVVSHCGGLMRSTQFRGESCPPKGWTCAVPQGKTH